jgi:hypothetical protein
MLKLFSFKKLRRDFTSSEKLWQSLSAGEFRLVNGPSDDRVSSRWVKCEIWECPHELPQLSFQIPLCRSPSVLP